MTTASASMSWQSRLMPAIRLLLFPLALASAAAASANTASPYVTVGVDIGNNAHLRAIEDRGAGAEPMLVFGARVAV